jgi:hypothetical protein
MDAINNLFDSMSSDRHVSLSLGAGDEQIIMQRKSSTKSKTKI